MAGAAAMYLMDPESGRRRRKYLKEQAGDYLEGAEEMIGTGWETVAQKARKLSGNAVDKAQDYGQRVVDQARDLGSSLQSGWSKNARDYIPSTRQMTRDLRDYGQGLWGRARGRMRRATGEESSPVIPVVLTAVGCCALGAGLMYVIDPQRGRARRAWLMDKTQSIFRRTGRSVYRGGRDLVNRAYGAAHEMGAMGRQETASGNLTDRVRSELGRITSHPRLVEVMCDSNGAVTLSGCVLENEARPLISQLESLPGVKLVISRLETVNGVEELDRRAGSRTQHAAQM
jgi:gas vesicle protein